MRRRISRAQQTKNWCVGFSFPPPAYAGIHPTLYLFGFRADALNSHSPPYLPGFDPRSCLERFDTFSGSSGKVVGFSCRGLRSSETVRGPPGPLGGFRGLWCPRFRGALPGFGAPLRPLEASRGPLRAPPGCLRAPPGASGRPAFGAFFWVWTFQATSWRRLASGPPERRPENPGRPLQKTPWDAPRDAPGTPPDAFQDVLGRPRRALEGLQEARKPWRPLK